MSAATLAVAIGAGGDPRPPPRDRLTQRQSRHAAAPSRESAAEQKDDRRNGRRSSFVCGGAVSRPRRVRTSDVPRAGPSRVRSMTRWFAQWRCPCRSWLHPPSARAEAQGHRRQQGQRRGEARQVRLHDQIPRFRCDTVEPAAGRSPGEIPGFASRLATGLPWAVLQRGTIVIPCRGRYRDVGARTIRRWS